MAEGPEVRRVARRLNAALAGGELIAIESRLKRAQAWLAEHPNALVGRRFERVESRGKHILMRLDGGYFIQSHLLMFGRWLIYPPLADPGRDPGDRAWLRATTALAVLHRGQVLNIGQGDPADAVPALAVIGPDILDEPFDAPQFRERLFGLPLDTEIGVALLDQRVAAGVGNYLRAEMLFVARLNPFRRLRTLSKAESVTLETVIPQIAQTVLRNDGWLVPPEIAAQSAGTERGWSRKLWVFRRTNRPCRLCGTPIRQQRQGPDAGRIIYWCPTCQPAPLNATSAR